MFVHTGYTFNPLFEIHYYSEGDSRQSRRESFNPLFEIPQPLRRRGHGEEGPAFNPLFEILYINNRLQCEADPESFQSSF